MRMDYPTSHSQYPTVVTLRYKFAVCVFLGLKPIPLSTPDWKVPILQRKNRLIVEEYLVTVIIQLQKSICINYSLGLGPGSYLVISVVISIPRP